MSLRDKLKVIGLSSLLIATSSFVSPSCNVQPSEAIVQRYKVEDLNKYNFNKEVLESKLPVLVDFYTPWCHYCKEAEPYIKKFEKEFRGKIKFFRYNCDEDHSIPDKYNVEGYPTFIIYSKGKASDRVIGFDMEQLKAMLLKYSKRK